MDFGFYYRPDVNRILFHYAPGTGAAPCCYDTIVSESRIASYIGIAKGELPRKEYFGPWRTFPDTCDWSWPETKPLGFNATYLDVTVFEGAYPYEDFRVVPGWGGSMFEALMPALFVPEEEWAPRSWAVNHPLTITAQIHHGLVEAEYGYWGFSPANIPEGGYYRVRRRRHRHEPGRLPVEQRQHAVDRGFEGCPGRSRSRTRHRRPTRTASSPRTRPSWPCAGRPTRSWRTSPTSRRTSPIRCTTSGASATRSTSTPATVSDFYLSLDQGIIMAAIGNALADDILRDAFATKQVRTSCSR